MPDIEPITQPDLSSRPFWVEVARDFAVRPGPVYKAWTEQFDRWFAAPGTLVMVPRVNAPFFFETTYEAERHPHYGRFLRVEPERVVEMTWVNAAGTRGFETVVTVDLTPIESGTHVRLVHAGFPDQELADRHGEAWPKVLEHLEKVLLSGV